MDKQYPSSYPKWHHSWYNDKKKCSTSEVLCFTSPGWERMWQACYHCSFYIHGRQDQSSTHSTLPVVYPWQTWQINHSRQSSPLGLLLRSRFQWPQPIGWTRLTRQNLPIPGVRPRLTGSQLLLVPWCPGGCGFLVSTTAPTDPLGLAMSGMRVDFHDWAPAIQHCMTWPKTHEHC